MQGQLFMTPAGVRGKVEGSVSLTHTSMDTTIEQNRSRAGYPVIPSAHYTTHSTGLSLLSCPGKVQGQLS